MHSDGLVRWGDTAENTNFYIPTNFGENLTENNTLNETSND